MSKSKLPAWEEAIQQQIQTTLLTPIGLADDPDNVLSGDVLLSLVQQGVEVVNVSSPFVLRFEYEARVRRQSSSQRVDSSILFVPDFPLVNVPYDIQKRSVIVSLSFANGIDHRSG